MNKKLKNLLTRNCGITSEVNKELQLGVRVKKELDWRERREIAKEAVEMRNWMFKVAKENNFKFHADIKKDSEEFGWALIKDSLKPKMLKVVNAAVKSNLKAMLLKGEDIGGELAKIGEEGDDENERILRNAKMESTLGAMINPKKSVGAFGLSSMAGGKTKQKLNYTQYSENDIETLLEYNVTNVKAAKIRKICDQCSNVLAFGIKYVRETTNKLHSSSDLIQDIKGVMERTEKESKDVVFLNKARVKVLQKEKKEIGVLAKKLEKDLGRIEKKAGSIMQPLRESKMLLDKLEEMDKNDKTGILKFAEIATKEAGMSMGEALLDAKKRSAAGLPQKNMRKEEERRREIELAKTPEILVSARNKYNVLVEESEDYKGQVVLFKKERNVLVGDDERVNIEIGERTGLITRATEENVKILLNAGKKYESVIEEVLMCQCGVKDANFVVSKMGYRVKFLQKEARAAQGKEDFNGLVEEGCGYESVDGEVRSGKGGGGESPITKTRSTTNRFNKSNHMT